MFEVLGGVRAYTSAGPADLRGQVRRLLGVLLAARTQAVSTEMIIERLWGEDAPRTASKAVHVIAGRLRRALEPDLRAHEESRFVITTTDGYRLASDGIADLDRYVMLVEEAERSAVASPESALSLLEAALELWDRPWGEQADEPWLFSHVAGLEERHRCTEELWGEVLLRSGRAGAMLGRLRGAVEREPLREQRWQQLIVALYRDGRQTEALRAYDEIRERLRDDLGIEPGVELQRLQLSVLEHDPVLRQDPTEHASSGVSSFVGRVEELTWLSQSSTRSRLLSVVGIGGIGKTRLVEEFASRQSVLGQRVKKVTFGTLTEGHRTARHLAAALGLEVESESSSGIVDVIAAALSSQPTLLILDAVENVSDHIVPIVLTLFERCRRLRIVVTSRVQLGVAGEVVLPLKPLPLGSLDGDIVGTALELLIDRAGLAAMLLDTGMKDRLQSRCDSTGGVPLLIELAASAALSGGDDPDSQDRRYATVRASIEQATEAVDENALDLLKNVALLPGGVAENTVASLGGMDRRVTRRALRQLAWVHLLVPQPGRTSLRYQILDPIREAVNETQPHAQREAAIASATSAIEGVFRAIEPDLLGGPVIACVDAAEDEHDNLCFLISDRLRNDPRSALDLAIAGSLLWPIRGGGVQGRLWLEEAIAATAPEGHVAWSAVLAIVRTARRFGEVAQLTPRLERAVEEMRSANCRDQTYLTLLGHLATSIGWRGERKRALPLLEEARNLSREFGSAWAEVQVDKLWALDLALTGNFTAARDAQRSFARKLLDLGDAFNAGNSFYLSAALGDMAGHDDVTEDIRIAQEMAIAARDISQLGQLLLLQARAVKRKRDVHARQLLADAVERLTELGGIRAAALARRDLGILDLEDGDIVTAKSNLQQALSMLLQLDRPAAAIAAAGLAMLAHSAGEASNARHLTSAALALRANGAVQAPEDAEKLNRLLTSLPTLTAVPGEWPDDDLVLQCAGVD